MGGRGTHSAGGGKLFDNGEGGAAQGGKLLGSDGIPGPEETRQDVINMLDNAYFKGVNGTGSIDTAMAGAYAMQLQNLEKKFGAIKDSNVNIQGAEGADYIAAVAFNPNNPREMTLVINATDMGNIKTVLKNEFANGRAGWSMPTDGSVMSLARYTITHEYGHILHNQLYASAKDKGYNGSREKFVESAYREIQSIARSKYGATGNELSQYGKTNTREYFSEVFANSQLGKPNALGKAMNDWLKNQGF